MTHNFDIIVIGAGSGGLNIASFMNSIGASVLLIDRSDDRIGGDCLNTGCVPSKALIHVARLCQSARSAEQFGLTQGGAVDLKIVMDYVRSAQTIIREHENAEYFRSKGMTVVLGEATFAGRDSVRVGDATYRGKKIIIATGSRPRQLSIPGTELVVQSGRLHTNETIFSLTTLPKRLLVIGGGPIGVELGQAFAHLGSEVTIVTNDDRILLREDADSTRSLEGQLVRDGVTLFTNSESVRFRGESALVIRDTRTDSETTIQFDLVLVAIGREIDVTSLEVANAGIAVDDRGRLVLDAYLRTTNKRVFACGDSVGQHQFTHAAELHARLLIRNFLTPLFKKRLNTDALSSVTYTTPEIATYGQSPEQLKQRGIPFTVLESSFARDDRAITDDGRDGYVKMYVHSKTKQILGGTMVAPGAGELIQELLLATSSRLTTKAIFNKIYPYPTASRINKHVVLTGERARLTPLARRLLRTLFRLGF